MPKNGLAIVPTGEISTIADINEARANMIPIDYGIPEKAEWFPGYEVLTATAALILTPGAAFEVTADFSGIWAEEDDISSIVIDWGDSTPTENLPDFTPVSHTYAGGGTYAVTVTVGDPIGRTGTVTGNVTAAA